MSQYGIIAPSLARLSTFSSPKMSTWVVCIGSFVERWVFNVVSEAIEVVHENAEFIC